MPITGEEPAAPGSRLHRIEPADVLVKIALVGVAIVVLMVVARDQRWAAAGRRHRALRRDASRRAPSPTGAWYACKQGVLTGFPNLEGDSCTSAGIVMHQEVWRCDAPLVSTPGY